MFLLFAYDNYYPIGGMRDFVAKSDDLDSLKKQGADLLTDPKDPKDWVHIADLNTGDIWYAFLGYKKAVTWDKNTFN